MSTRIALARLFSIVGHPLLVLPGAGLVVAHAQGMPEPQLRWLALGFATLAAVVLAYSWHQVRAGKWGHVDASERPERRALNVFLVLLLYCGAGGAWLASRQPEVPLALALVATLVVAALLLGRFLKLSLHAGLAAFATALLWPLQGMFAAALAITAAVAWSRLALQRHSAADVSVAIVLGSAAGYAYHSGVVALH